MPRHQATHHRQAVLQLVNEGTAVALASDVILQDHGQSITVTGREAVTAFLRAFFRHAFAETTLEISNLLADKDTATLSISLSGRQVAPFWELPCTGRAITLSLVLIGRFHANQLLRIELFYDAVSLLRQLGLALQE